MLTCPYRVSKCRRGRMQDSGCRMLQLPFLVLMCLDCSVYFSLQRFKLCCALGKFTKSPVFWPYTPIMDLTDITDLNKMIIQMPKPVYLNFATASFVGLQCCLSFCLSHCSVHLNGKKLHISRGQSQNRWRWNIVHWFRKLPFDLMNLFFSYSDMLIPIFL